MYKKHVFVNDQCHVTLPFAKHDFIQRKNYRNKTVYLTNDTRVL